MHTRLMFLLGTIALGAISASAQALTLPAADAGAGASPAIVEVAGRHCNHGYHWVGPHHTKDGHLIRGRCVRDHH